MFSGGLVDRKGCSLVAFNDKMIARMTENADISGDRNSAKMLLDRVLARLQADEEAYGRGVFFEGLKPLLMKEGMTTSYDELAVELGTSEARLRMAVHRLRLRFRELLRHEIDRTWGGDSFAA